MADIPKLAVTLAELTGNEMVDLVLTLEKFHYEAYELLQVAMGL